MRQKKIITTAHHKGIGEVIVTWARLEFHMLYAFAAILKTKIHNEFQGTES